MLGLSFIVFLLFLIFMVFNRFRMYNQYFTQSKTCNVSLLPLERASYSVDCIITNIYIANYILILCELCMEFKLYQSCGTYPMAIE